MDEKDNKVESQLGCKPLQGKNQNFDFGLVHILVAVRKKGSNITLRNFQCCILHVRYYIK